MSEQISKDIGLVTAYGYAKDGGYEGTEEQFMEDLATAKNQATVATTKATEAAASATAAETAKQYAQAFTGAPRVASAAEDMTDEDLIYVYTGSEMGYTSGNWYYHNGTTWVSGGTYNSTAFTTDPTFTVAGAAADAAACGDLKSATDAMEDAPEIDHLGQITANVAESKISNASYRRLVYANIEGAYIVKVTKLSGATFTVGFTADIPANNVPLIGERTVLVNGTEFKGVIPTGAKYIAISYYNTNDDTVDEATMLASVKIYGLFGAKDNDVRNIIFGDLSPDLSIAPVKNVVISVTTGKWTGTTGNTSYFVSVPENAYKVKISANSSGDASIALLKSDSAVSGETPDYATGAEESKNIQKGFTDTFPIPSDCKFIQIKKTTASGGSSTDFTPASVVFYTKKFFDETDTMLSVSGMPADAKTTGDKIIDLNNDIDTLNNMERFTIPYGDLTEGEGIRASDGDIREADSLVRTGYVDIRKYAGETIQYARRKSTASSSPSSNTVGMAFYSTDSVEGYISGHYQLQGQDEVGYIDAEINVPSDAVYARFTLYPDGTVPYSQFYIKGYSDIQKRVNYAVSRIDEFYEFDDVPWRLNFELDSNGDKIATGDHLNWGITDILPIEPGDTVRYTGALQDSDDNRLICWAYEYNGSINPAFIKRTHMTYADSDNVVSVVMSENTKFVRFMYGYDDSTLELTKATCQSCFAAETTRTPEELNRPSLNILFIGNSKAYDSVSYAPAVLRSLGVDANINIGIIYHGGQGLEEHYKAFVADTPDWCVLTESVNLTKWRNVLGGGDHDYVCSGLDCFTYRKWDIISFQQATTKAGNYDYYKPWLNGIIEYINDNVGYKWKMVWNNVDTTSAGCDPDEPNYNPDKMPSSATEASHEITVEHYGMVISALQDMLAENPVEVVFPVATATQNARNTSLASLGDNEQLLYDWKHAQEGIPCLIEGYTIAIKLMELLGIHNKSVLNDRTVVDSDFLSTWAIQGQHGNPVGFEDETTGDANRKIAQKCAILACQRPMELSNIVTELPANYPDPYPT